MQPLTIIAQFKVKTGQEQKVLEGLNAMIAPSLAESGCLAYQPYAHPQDPQQLIIIERWTSREALEEHFKTAHFLKVKELLDTLLSQPFELTELVSAT